ncbi:MAG: hypothetical protein PHE68_05495 [Candidatus Peribacteraceae bacterium]|nr:hypothetical protein [Candidatus Peribacteraceae bacterium]MDD5075336.1 hypothetical protein [Candidatus Peribacteraceae bacterium]
MIVAFLHRLLAFLTTSAIAAAGAELACRDVPGGCTPENAVAKLAGIIGSILVDVAAGGAVLFVVIGGALMLISTGDDGKATKGKNAVIYALVGFIVAVSSQSILQFVFTTASPLADSSDPLIDAMSLAVTAMLTIFNITFVAIALYAGIRLIVAKGKTDEYTKSINMIIWAIVGAIVINLSYTIVSSISSIGF